MSRKGDESESVVIEQRIEAPARNVASYVGDFRNAKEWMVGVEGVERLAEDAYRLRLDAPIGKIEPEVRVVEHGESRVRWVYASIIDGGGLVEISPKDDGGCVVRYAGVFRLKRKLLNRAARAIGIERFARKNGERSLARLKHLMEARRY